MTEEELPLTCHYWLQDDEESDATRYCRIVVTGGLAKYASNVVIDADAQGIHIEFETVEGTISSLAEQLSENDTEDATEDDS